MNVWPTRKNVLQMCLTSSKAEAHILARRRLFAQTGALALKMKRMRPFHPRPLFSSESGRSGGHSRIVVPSIHSSRSASGPCTRSPGRAALRRCFLRHRYRCEHRGQGLHLPDQRAPRRAPRCRRAVSTSARQLRCYHMPRLISFTAMLQPNGYDDTATS